MKVFKISLISTALLTAMSASYAAPVASNAKLQREIYKINAQTQMLRQEVRVLRAKVRKSHAAPRATLATSGTHNMMPGRFGHALTVTTSPLMGEKTAYDGSDVLQQISKQNEDLTLLQERAKFYKSLPAGTNVYRPIIEVSGGLQGNLYGVDGYGRVSTSKGVNLGTADLDIQGVVNPWVAGFIGLSYDDSPVSTGNRAPKGTVYLNRGFITVGNLNAFPVYGSIGEMYVPFGVYHSMLISTPMTMSLGRIRSASALAGFEYNGINGSVFGYSGEMSSGNSDVFKQGGFNIAYTHQFDAKDSVDGGFSLISNLADSQGMQNTGTTSNFTGFGQMTTGNTNNLVHRVPAVDLNARVQMAGWTGIAEFISATKSFNVNDLSYEAKSSNVSGATPRALHLEVSYALNLMDKPVVFGASYGRTWESLALNLPQNSYTADAQVSLWHNTVEAIEYRHDDDYSSKDFAAGSGSTAVAGTGKSRNAYLAQIGVYF